MAVNSDHTFVILAYKESPYIENCIISVKNQKIQSKIIITTSTPSDYLIDLAKKHSIPLIINSKTEGIASDWNFAYQQVNTSFLTLVHQDDIYLENFLIDSIERFEKYPNLLITFTDYSEINEKGQIRKRGILLKIKKLLLFPFYIKKCINRSFMKKYLIAFGNPICCPSVTFSKNLLGKEFSFESKYKTNLDWAAWLKMSKLKGGFSFINKKLMNHRIHDLAETSICIQDNKRKEEDFELFQQMWPNWIAKILGFFYKKSYKNILK